MCVFSLFVIDLWPLFKSLNNIAKISKINTFFSFVTNPQIPVTLCKAPFK